MTSQNLAGRRRWRRAWMAVSMMLGAALALTPVMPGAGRAGETGSHVDAGVLWLPDGAAPSGPIPVVIILHDTPGLDQRGPRYGAQITAAGVAVIYAELQDYSADGADTTVASDDDTAVALARLTKVIDFVWEDPRFAHAAIGLLAFGAAGEVVMRAAAEQPTGGRIAAMALLYPGCATLPAPTQGMALRSPVLLLHGDADPANLPADCAGLADRIARVAPVRRLQYAGAGFAWDLPPIGAIEALKLTWPGRPGERVAVSHWLEGAELSATQIAGFFARIFAAQP